MPLPPAASVAPSAPPQPTAAPSRVASPRPDPDMARAPIAAAQPLPPRAPDVRIGAPISRPVQSTSPAPAPQLRPTVAAEPVRSVPVDAPAARDSATPTKAPINPFLANDPNQKAKRLARALVSDMVAYHPQKRDEGMRAGTLKQLFREEIKKSYEEYVDQIGKEFAESTSHFQDALNDVLAGGKKVF